MKARTIAKGIANGATASLFALGLAMSAAAQDVTEVHAGSEYEWKTVTVGIGDLDLNSAAGQEKLNFRLRVATEEVCGSANPRRTGSVALAARNADCQEASLVRALASVNRGAVAAL
jgi:UrcA family protein